MERYLRVYLYLLFIPYSLFCCVFMSDTTLSLPRLVRMKNKNDGDVLFIRKFIVACFQPARVIFKTIAGYCDARCTIWPRYNITRPAVARRPIAIVRPPIVFPRFSIILNIFVARTGAAWPTLPARVVNLHSRHATASSYTANVPETIAPIKIHETFRTRLTYKKASTRPKVAAAILPDRRSVSSRRPRRQTNGARRTTVLRSTDRSREPTGRRVRISTTCQCRDDSYSKRVRIN